MNQRTQRSVVYGVVSFVIIFALCIAFGNSSGSQTTIWVLTLQYLAWALPASIIIGIVTYFMK